ncbi:helix-turn-helix transcriptional regulator [Chitinophaga filiformis]|uniref:helix-turn-helix domain-containing protein n=1 Tax=Chitinophaga filiformis TaxID=104663 RepID=UPI001F476CF3|nr:helix-turn-helix transcriptional regulator [Chitinophaga filiformis]MCF6407294.1 helix-turn-helix transcriptional regulator [Chitinophaga filiformis]
MKTSIRIRKGCNLVEDLSNDFFYNVVTKDAVNVPSHLGAGKIRGLYFRSDLNLYKLFSIRKKLMENSHLTIKLPALAKEIGMGQSKMVKLFKQVFNRSISQFAQKARIIKAKNLLSSKKYSVSEVGYMVGYSNMTHFAKAFRKYYKVNPSEYLKDVLLNKIST